MVVLMYKQHMELQVYADKRVFPQKVEWNIVVMCLSTKSQNARDDSVLRRC